MGDLRRTAEAPDSPARWKRWHFAAAGVGAAVGVLGRDWPVDLAFALTPGTATPDCPTTGIVDCLAEDVVTLLEDAFRVGVTALAISVLAVLVALPALTFAAVRIRRGRRAVAEAFRSGDGTDWLAAGELCVGTALLLSGGWLPAVFLLSFLRS